jgi:hypothetical protein
MVLLTPLFVWYVTRKDKMDGSPFHVVLDGCDTAGTYFEQLVRFFL